MELLKLFTPLHREPLDQTPCSKGSWAAAGQEALGGSGGAGGRGTGRRFLTGISPGSRVLSADRSCQPRLAQPLCQAGSSRKSRTRASLCQGHSPQPGERVPG